MVGAVDGSRIKRPNRASRLMRGAAFFDFDGTLVRGTIAHYYSYFRRARMSSLVGRLWYGGFLAKCGWFLLLDRIDRNSLNRVFYRQYRGLPVDEIMELAAQCHHDVIVPRLFEEAPAVVAEHRRAGRSVVLVTGSLDFIVAPLARELNADSVIAPSLQVADGRFTGELNGPPIAREEKANRMRAHAQASGIDLADSYAIGDSISDLPMLECVGYPQVVNPDRKLARLAEARGWPIHRWTTKYRSVSMGRRTKASRGPKPNE
jgi:HAD superfamily hydrolase (TIGR01490 family)